jgi:hypothetical protein
MGQCAGMSLEALALLPVGLVYGSKGAITLSI